MAQFLRSAAEGDAHDYLTLAEEMEERDLLYYGSVLRTHRARPALPWRAVGASY